MKILFPLGQAQVEAVGNKEEEQIFLLHQNHLQKYQKLKRIG